MPMLASPRTNLPIRIVYLVAATTLCAVTVSANAYFGATLGSTIYEKAAYTGASISADLIKCSSLAVVIMLWAKRQFALALAAAVLGMMCLAWSVTAAAGFALTSRDLAASQHASSRMIADGWTTTISRAGHQLTLVEGSRPVGVIEAELATVVVADAIWKRTQNCTQVTIPESRDACAPVLKLRQELASAKATTALKDEIDQARRELAIAPMVGSKADPQVAGLAAVMGIQEAALKHGLALMLAVLIELGSAIGFAVAGAAKPTPPSTNASQATSRRKPTGRPAVDDASTSKVVPFPPRVPRRVQDRQPTRRAESSLSSWWAEAVRSDRSGCVGARDAYRAYCAWARETGTAAVTETAFGRHVTVAISGLGGQKVHRAAGAFYLGISLGSVQALKKAG